MDIPKTDVGGSNRGPGAGPQRGSGFTRGFQARQPNAPASRASEKWCQSQKSDGKTRGPLDRGTASRLSNSQLCLSWAYDGAFSLRKYLCDAAGELFRTRRPDARHFASTDQAEPAACCSTRPRSGPALQPGGSRDPRRQAYSGRGGPDCDGLCRPPV